ncbi:hypothetical protein KL918_005418, partial [Ogataea parapolymorpha]
KLPNWPSPSGQVPKWSSPMTMSSQCPVNVQSSPPLLIFMPSHYCPHPPCSPASPPNSLIQEVLARTLPS